MCHERMSFPVLPWHALLPVVTSRLCEGLSLPGGFVSDFWPNVRVALEALMSMFVEMCNFFRTAFGTLFCPHTSERVPNGRGKGMI
jgi:hypothetical protein